MPVQPASHSTRSRQPVEPEVRAPGADTLTRASGTRTSAAWFGVCVGVLVLVALVVFMLQNTGPVAVSFLGMTGTAPLALALLIAGLGVGIVVLVFASLRIGQLRRRAAGGHPTGARR
jgi:uncharacterized integral membrane protein